MASSPSSVSFPIYTIRPYPLNSPEASNLISALDAELASLYPDWDDLPHPGDNIEDTPEPDLGDRSLNHNASPRSADVVDVKSEVTVGPETREPAIKIPKETSKGKKSIKESVKVEHGDDLHFFVAFDNATTNVIKTAQPETKTQFQAPNLDSDVRISTLNRNEDDNDRRDLPVEQEQAVGCVALRLLPFFPFHRPTHHLRPNRNTDQQSGILTAELKRMYVVPSHRIGKIKTNPSSQGPSLAIQLLQHAECYAKEVLGAKRLVLETGRRQHGAIRLYGGQGWRERVCFGDYFSAREEVGGASLCFEKMI